MSFYGTDYPDPVDPDEAFGKSWQPIDLGPILRGEYTRPEPSVGLCRTDGLRLLYPGKEHTVIGEMESGKSWYAAGCAAAELVAGNVVAYVHFEEADPTDTVERLIALGSPRRSSGSSCSSDRTSPPPTSG